MAEREPEKLYKEYSQLPDAHLRAKQAELKLGIDNCKVTLGTKLWNAAEALVFGGVLGSGAAGSIFAWSNRKALGEAFIPSGDRTPYQPGGFMDDAARQAEVQWATAADSRLNNIENFLSTEKRKHVTFSGIVGATVFLGGTLAYYKRLNRLALVQDGTQKASQLTVVDQILRDRELQQLHPEYKREQVAGAVLGDARAQGRPR